MKTEHQQESMIGDSGRRPIIFCTHSTQRKRFVVCTMYHVTGDKNVGSQSTLTYVGNHKQWTSKTYCFSVIFRAAWKIGTAEKNESKLRHVYRRTNPDSWECFRPNKVRKFGSGAFSFGHTWSRSECIWS